MSIVLENFSCGKESYYVKDVNLEIEDGKWYFLIGDIGSGKTTLLLGIANLLNLKKGILKFNGKELEKKEVLKEFRKKSGVLLQDSDSQFFNSTVEKEILFCIKDRSEEEKKERLEKIIDMLEIEEEKLERSPFELSGGEKKRVALASILIKEPKYIFLDEPTAGLDSKGKKIFYKILKKLKEKGCTIIQISHDLEEVFKYSDIVLKLEKGRVNKGEKEKFLQEIESLKIINYIKRKGKNIGEVLKILGEK